MTFSEGGNLTDVVVKTELDEPMMAAVLKECLLALNFLHKHSIIHRDVSRAQRLAFWRLTTAIFRSKATMCCSTWMAPCDSPISVCVLKRLRVVKAALRCLQAFALTCSRAPIERRSSALHIGKLAYKKIHLIQLTIGCRPRLSTSQNIIIKSTFGVSALW